MKLLFFLFFIELSLFSFSQKSNSIFFDSKINNEKLELGKTYFSSILKDSLRVDLLKFYVSNIKLLKRDTVVASIDGYYLIDMQNKKSISFSSNEKIDFDSISFEIGVDSATHELGAMDGDLDPTKGMYWTWQSGYIFFKMEGSLNLLKSNKGSFTYHIGGYNQMFPTIKKLTFPARPTKDIHILIDIDRFLEKWNCVLVPEIMSPSAKASEFSNLFKYLFLLNKNI